MKKGCVHDYSELDAHVCVCVSHLLQELFSRISQALQQKATSLQDLSSVQEPSSSGGIDIKKIQSGTRREITTLSMVVGRKVIQYSLFSISSLASVLNNNRKVLFWLIYVLK